MSFCTNCGAPMTSQFCTKCGAQAGQAAASTPPPPSSSPVIIPASQPAPPAPGAPTPKKRGPIFWVLMGCLGLVLIGGVLIVGGGLYVAYKAKQAGLDPELMQKNPGLAVAKMMAVMNPDIEVLAVDENRGIIQVRDKKTGKTLTINLEDAKKGKISFVDEKNQKVELQAQGEGEKGSLDIKGPEGSLHIGTGAAELPEWLPAYPGAEDAGAISATSKDGKGASYSFKTKDSVDDVVAFYEDALKTSGLEVQKTSSQVPGQGTMVILAGKDSAAQKTVQATIAGKGDETTVFLTFEAKK